METIFRGGGALSSDVIPTRLLGRFVLVWLVWLRGLGFEKAYPIFLIVSNMTDLHCM